MASVDTGEIETVDDRSDIDRERDSALAKGTAVGMGCRRWLEVTESGAGCVILIIRRSMQNQPPSESPSFFGRRAPLICSGYTKKGNSFISAGYGKGLQLGLDLGFEPPAH